MEVIDLHISFTSILTSVIVGNLFIMVIWFILSTNQSIRYININVIIIFILLTMIRLFLPFEYGFTHNIPCKMILPSISKFVFNHFSIGYGRLYVYQVLLLIWMMGFLIRLFQTLVQYYKICKSMNCLPNCYTIKSILDEVIKEKKIYVNFKVVKISGLMTPAIVGLRYPTIMIPDNEYTKEELTFILRHETEHFYQCDLWIKALLEIFCALYWWNPFCQIFKGQTAKALEMRVDSKVIKTMNEQQRLKYLECLLKVAKSHTKRTNNLSLCFNGKRTTLKQRFCFILDYQGTKQKKWILANVFCAGIIIFLSAAIILEPYSIKYENTIGTFTISEKNSFFVKNESGYDLYVNATYYATVDKPKDGLSELPVYESLEKEIK